MDFEDEEEEEKEDQITEKEREGGLEGNEDEMDIDDIFKSIISTHQMNRRESQAFNQISDNEGVNEMIQQYPSLKSCIVSDIGGPRLYLPELNDVNLTPSLIWKVIKDLIGKDLTKVEMPAFINEASTIL